MWSFLRRFFQEKPDPQEDIRRRVESFRRLLEHNHQALAAMADMEEKLSGDYLFDFTYLETQVRLLEEHVPGMATELNRLTHMGYPELVPLVAKLTAELRAELAKGTEIPETPDILPLAELTRESAPAVGAKMANLGEMANRLGLKVPPGFAVTAAAYKRFMEAGGLAQELATRLRDADVTDLAGLETLSRELQERVRQAPLPPELEENLRQAAAGLSCDRLAVRSSAVGEDTGLSFAGQFATLLNVPAADLPQHYKEVIASKFTPQAIFYWKFQGFSVEELPMAVGVLAMVPARASGVAFSLDPQDPESDTLVISGVWGLGRYAVEGRVTPDLWRLSRLEPFEVVEARPGNKKVALYCREETGCTESVLSPEAAAAPCLEPRHLQQLARIALLLERHFGGPQDMEWAVDDSGEVVLLQTRPLRVSRPAAALGEARRLPDRTPILNQGVRAVGGVAAGPVALVEADTRLEDLPPGAVVVTRRPAIRLVVVMNRISAILTEVGSPTDHMTILAREFQVPTLVEVRGALRALRPGQMVTVDADNARVYDGIVTEVLKRRRPRPELWQQDELYRRLRSIVAKVVPLHLLDPTAPEFSPAHCRTLHDVTRFCHEKAMDAMFALEADQAVQAKGVRRLVSDLPLNLYILDLGGGVRPEATGELREEDIVSRPFQALLRGLRHPQVRWAGTVAADLKGFISVWANTMYDLGKADTALGGKSFALITDSYLNFHSRLGYHFGLVDAYLSEHQDDNYITFQFKGGAASVDRRERRVKLLQKILEDLGFTVQVQGDVVQARLVKYSLPETESMLEFVGLLMVFCRQLDLALVSDALMERCYQAFKEKDYSLKFLRPWEDPPDHP
ncbi:MAG: PEP/pyruvate-binding domain-containing protein [Desulfobaccales bacterium]